MMCANREMRSSGMSCDDSEAAHTHAVDVPTRVLRFPQQYSLGWLFHDVPEEVNEQGWECIAEARGAVLVLATESIILDVDWNKPADLSGLSALAADDLYGLQFRGVPMRDEDMAHLQGLTGLRYLMLDHVSISDAALAHVHPLTKLERLFLISVPITDAGLAHLHSLKHLRALMLTHSRATQRGIKSLRRALPACVIDSSVR
jgi:hypothetical protein